MKKNKLQSNTQKSIILTLIFLLAIILVCYKNSYAIGELSIGLNIGATYDPNNLQDEINRYNTAMMVYKEANSGTIVSKMDVPYSFVWGMHIKYQFNYLLFRLGCYFSKPGDGIKGTITPQGGLENRIRIKTYQNSFPVSLGFILPLRKRTYFYIGGGLTYHMAYLEVTQSRPDQTSVFFPNAGLSTNSMDVYTEDFPGYHLLLGIETPVIQNLTISLEWLHQEGRSYPLTNDGIDLNGNAVSTPKKTINVKGDFILFSINYYIAI